MRCAKSLSRRVVAKVARKDTKEGESKKKVEEAKQKVEKWRDAVRSDSDADVKERKQSKDYWTSHQAEARERSLSLPSSDDTEGTFVSDADSLGWAMPGTYEEAEELGLFDCDKRASVEVSGLYDTKDNVEDQGEAVRDDYNNDVVQDGRSAQQVELERDAMIANIYLYEPEPDTIASPKPQRSLVVPRLESWEAQLADDPDQALVDIQNSVSTLSGSQDTLIRPTIADTREMVEGPVSDLAGRNLCQKMKSSILEAMRRQNIGLAPRPEAEN